MEIKATCLFRYLVTPMVGLRGSFMYYLILERAQMMTKCFSFGPLLLGSGLMTMTHDP